MNQIIIECKFKAGDVVFFRNHEVKSGTAYSFGTINAVHSMEKASYSSTFKPVYEIDGYGGRTFYINETSLITVESFMATIKVEQEKSAKNNPELLDEIEPTPKETTE